MNRYCEELCILRDEEAILEIASLLFRQGRIHLWRTVARCDNVEVFGAFAMVETKSRTDCPLHLVCSGKF